MAVFLAMLVLAPLMLLAIILLAVPVALYYAWIGSIMWGWFLVPLGLPALSVLQLWGITITLAILRPVKSSMAFEFKGKDADAIAAHIFTVFLAPLVALLIGYIIKFWVM